MAGRACPLALARAGDRRLDPLLVLKTQGDLILDRPLSAVGGKGLFTKEIEAALLDGRADLAVHSAKDLPWDLPAGLTLAAIPPRADVRDALIVRPGLSVRVANRTGRSFWLCRTLCGSGPAACGGPVSCGTCDPICRSSPARQRRYPAAASSSRRARCRCAGECGPEPIGTRGAHRGVPGSPGDAARARGRGALGIECRSDDKSLLLALHRLADAGATAAVQAERAFRAPARRQLPYPIGALATCATDDSLLTIRGMVGSLDGTRILRAERTGPVSHPIELGAALGNELLAQGL